MKYTKEDVDAFKKVCPSNLLGSTDEEMKQHMAQMGWKPAEKKQIVIDAPIGEADTKPMRPLRTTWKITDRVTPVIFEIKCNTCGYDTHAIAGKPPDYCPGCNLKTDPKHPFGKP